MRYQNPHQPYQQPQASQMNPMQQQQLQLLQLQQQLLQQQAMNPAQQVNQQAQQQQTMLQLLQQNPQMMMMVQNNPSLLSNPQFQQQLLLQAQASRLQQGQTTQFPMMGVQQGQQFPQDNRFNTDNSGVQQGLLQAQPAQQVQLQSEAYTGRFNNQPQQSAPAVTEPQPTQVQAVTQPKIPSHIVSIDPIYFYNNKKISLTARQDKFSEKLVISEPKAIFADGLEPVIDHAIETAKESIDDNKLIYLVDAVIRDSTVTVPRDEQFNKLFAGDARQLYKTLKAIYAEATNLDTILIAERLNRNLTGLVNQFLKVNLDNVVSIDSFVEDYNDLLKLLRSKFEDAEDDLTEYLTNEIEEIRDLQENLDPKNQYALVEGVSVAYFANHHYLAGLKGVDLVVKLEPHKNNQFLIDMAQHIKIDTQRSKFYVVTYDRKLFLFSLNEKDEVFVELIDNL